MSNDGSTAFDLMLDSHTHELKRTVTIYANQYARQNIRELPGVFEVGTLGAIWFTDMWNRDREVLYVDSDPSWKSFIDTVADWIEFAICDLVIFYWP
jgi:hypothetical protein